MRPLLVPGMPGLRDNKSEQWVGFGRKCPTKGTSQRRATAAGVSDRGVVSAQRKEVAAMAQPLSSVLTGGNACCSGEQQTLETRYDSGCRDAQMLLVHADRALYCQKERVGRIQPKVKLAHLSSSRHSLSIGK